MEGLHIIHNDISCIIALILSLKTIKMDFVWDTLKYQKMYVNNHIQYVKIIKFNLICDNNM